MEILVALLKSFIRVLLLSAVVHFAARQASVHNPVPWSSLWLSFGVVFTANIFYTHVIYVKLLDPLRHLPLVNVPDIRVIIPITNYPRGEFALKVATQFQHYDMIRLQVAPGSTALFLISAPAIRDFLGTHQNDFAKPTGGSTFLKRILGHGLILSEGNVHKRQRKQLTSSFRMQNIRALHSLMLAKADMLLANIQRADEQSAGQGVDICTWAAKVTLDIIGNALLSKEYGSLNNTHVPVNEAFDRLTAASDGKTLLFMLSLVLPQAIVKRLPIKDNSEIEADVSVIRQSCEQSLDEVKARMKNGSFDNGDVLASIVADCEASHDEVIDQMISFLYAGYETTSTSIAWITHLLTLPENQHYQEKLREEVRAHPDCYNSPTELESMPWLNAICEETLRLFAPPSTARVAIRDTTLAGLPVKRGQIITLFPWAINQLPRYWGGDDANKFIPERWIDKKPDGTLIANNNGGSESNYCNLTFLHGNRSCIGKGFAKAELRLVIAKLYGQYVVSRLPGDDLKVVPAGSLTVKPEGGLFVTLQRLDAK